MKTTFRFFTTSAMLAMIALVAPSVAAAKFTVFTVDNGGADFNASGLYEPIPVGDGARYAKIVNSTPLSGMYDSFTGELMMEASLSNHFGTATTVTLKGTGFFFDSISGLLRGDPADGNLARMTATIDGTLMTRPNGNGVNHPAGPYEMVFTPGTQCCTPPEAPNSITPDGNFPDFMWMTLWGATSFDGTDFLAGVLGDDLALGLRIKLLAQAPLPPALLFFATGLLGVFGYRKLSRRSAKASA